MICQSPGVSICLMLLGLQAHGTSSILWHSLQYLLCHATSVRVQPLHIST